MCAWCNIYKYAILTFVQFYKSQHSSQTPRCARGQTQIAFYPPVPLAQLAALIPVTGVIPKQNKTKGKGGQSVSFHDQGSQSTVLKNLSLEIYLVSSHPAAGIALSLWEEEQRHPAQLYPQAVPRRAPYLLSQAQLPGANVTRGLGIPLPVAPEPHVPLMSMSAGEESSGQSIHTPALSMSDCRASRRITKIRSSSPTRR